MEHTLHIKTFDFHAAHYLPPEFGKCHRLHGHTFTFEDIEIVTEGIVDFSLIKKALDFADHTFIIPRKDLDIWEAIIEEYGNELPCEMLLVAMDEDSTVEAISVYMKNHLLKIPGVKSVKFTLYETKTSGIKEVNKSG